MNRKRQIDIHIEPPLDNLDLHERTRQLLDTPVDMICIHFGSSDDPIMVIAILRPDLNSSIKPLLKALYRHKMAGAFAIAIVPQRFVSEYPVELETSDHDSYCREIWSVAARHADTAVYVPVPTDALSSLPDASHLLREALIIGALEAVICPYTAFPIPGIDLCDVQTVLGPSAYAIFGRGRGPERWNQMEAITQAISALHVNGNTLSDISNLIVIDRGRSLIDPQYLSNDLLCAFHPELEFAWAHYEQETLGIDLLVSVPSPDVIAIYRSAALIH